MQLFFNALGRFQKSNMPATGKPYPTHFPLRENRQKESNPIFKFEDALQLIENAKKGPFIQQKFGMSEVYFKQPLLVKGK